MWPINLTHGLWRENNVAISHLPKFGMILSKIKSNAYVNTLRIETLVIQRAFGWTKLTNGLVRCTISSDSGIHSNTKPFQEFPRKSQMHIGWMGSSKILILIFIQNFNIIRNCKHLMNFISVIFRVLFNMNLGYPPFLTQYSNKLCSIIFSNYLPKVININGSTLSAFLSSSGKHTRKNVRNMRSLKSSMVS